MLHLRASTVRRLPAFAAAVVLTCALPASAAARSHGKTLTLHGGSATFTFSPTVYAALTKQTTGNFSVNNTIAPVAPASENASAFTLPISSGKINLTTLTGKVATLGGMNLNDNRNLGIISFSSQGELVSFHFVFGRAPQLLLTFVGQNKVPNVAVATLVTKGSKHSKHGKSVSLTNVGVKLTKAGAQLMNSFVSGFKQNELIGTVSIASSTS